MLQNQNSVSNDRCYSRLTQHYHFFSNSLNKNIQRIFVTIVSTIIIVIISILMISIII